MSLDTTLKALSVLRKVRPSLVNRPLEFNPPQDFQSWPALVRSYAKSLKEVEDRIVGSLAVRKNSPAKAIMMVYLHCCESMREPVTYREIGDLLNEATSDITVEPITEEAVRQHVKRERAWCLAKAWLDAINASGWRGHGDISGDVLTFHTAECNRQNFDLLTARAYMKEVFAYLRIKAFVYTNDLDLTFTYDVVKRAEVK